MNAILGVDRLPTGVIPLTSVITTVAYGSDEKVVLHFKHSSLFSDIPLAQLEANITERGNPGNVKGIRLAEIQLSSDILRRGFHFIDTPGLGSSIIENTRTTEAFLPEADAFILVTSYDSPLSQEELRTLRIIDGSGRRCFVVLNKQDGVSAGEGAEARAHVEAELSRMFGLHAPKLYSVSARQGLAARQAADATALNESGLPTLEAALISFLVNEKHKEFLIGICGRTHDLAAGNQSVADRLKALQQRLAEHAPDLPSKPEPTFKIVLGGLPDCEICRHVSDEVFSFLARYQRLLGDDAAVKAAHAECGGLCSRHMAQFEALAAPREMCTGFAPVLERQSARLRQAARVGHSRELLSAAVTNSLPTAASCPACLIAREAVSHSVRDIAIRQVLPSRAGTELQSVICVPHLAELVKELPAEHREAVLNGQADVLDRLADDMKRFALKQDGARRYLASREELAAGRRGLRALLGDPNAATEPLVPSAAGNVVQFARRQGAHRH